MNRSSKHSILKICNFTKLQTLNSFLNEYQRVGSLIIDSIWNNGYKEFSIKDDKLSFGKYIDYNNFNIQTDLSGRALSTLVTQICGIISSSTEKRRRLIWLRDKLIKENKDISFINKKLLECKISKPNFSKQMEVSSKCCDIKKGIGFDWFLSLKSIGKKYGKINIPIKGTKVSQKWLSKGKMMNSFLITNNEIQIRYTIESNPYSHGNTILGIDQGLNNVATCSDGQVTSKVDKHNHSLSSIIEKLSRKRKGSKSFKKAQDHRKNFINWSINQLNFKNIKEIRLEKIYNIGYKNSKSRKLSHWTNTLIRDKIKRMSQEMEVPLIEQDSTYRSQRCFVCGNVRKQNRKGSEYHCKNCGHKDDSDHNASMNHTIDLPPIPFSFRSLKKNLGDGFLWNPNSISSLDGVEFRVPLLNNQNNNHSFL